MNKTREIIYISIITVLLATLAGIYINPGMAPEAIIYSTTTSGEVVVNENGDTVLLADGSEWEAPFIEPNGSGGSGSKPAPRKKSTAAKPPAKLKAGTSERININSASAAQLKRLPGIGDVTAQKIIDYRNSSGGFRRIEDIMKVSGIASGKFNSIKEFIVVE
ncbi:MAG: ComEA family DNA-binding protein [Oscillospiraceae bacterium]|nr:ComEA family DNA-binding protein [Oscillospiraceae bacterium]